MLFRSSKTTGKKTWQKLEGLWEKYNIGKNKLTTPAGQQLIRQKGVRHTSMSIGDMVKIGNKTYVASSIGWTPVRFRNTVR